jgi:hypothetical protein
MFECCKETFCGLLLTMTDPASLILGITPLVLQAVKAYGTIYAKCKLYHQYAGIVQRLYKQLGTQRCLFLNECRLLLRLVVDDERLIRAMLKNDQHEEWDDPTLREQWILSLDDNYDACMRIVEEICRGLQGLEEDLQRFDSVAVQRQPVRILQTCIRPLREEEN